MGTLDRSYVHGTSAIPLSGDTIGRLFDRTVARRPGGEALVVCHQNVRWSWADLSREVDDLAAGLLALGLEPGERIGIWSPNNAEWVVTQLATAKAGLILVNVNPAYRVAELEYALNKVDCRALITATRFKSSNYMEMLDDLAPEIAAAEPGRVRAARLPDLRFVITLDAEPRAGMLTYDDVKGRGGSDERKRLEELATTLQFDDPINIQFTSGTTGAPKASTLTHHNIVNNAFFAGQIMELSEDDRLCIPVPMYHCFGMVLGTLTSVAHGATMVFPSEGFDALEVLKAVSAERCTALHGIPTMFIVVFLIMLPIHLKTNDAILAWQAGLAWAFIIGVIVLIGAFVRPTIRKYTPRAAMLGTLAGISIAFISMHPVFQMWEVPWIALVAFGIILISWTANVRLPFGIPGGLAAIIVGTVMAWVAVMLGWSGYMEPSAVGESLSQFGIRLPIPSGDVITGLGDVWPLLATAIPLGVYNFTEGMNNVESAAAAGDNYNLRHILLADGVGAVVGSALGSPFPPAVYIGHPGWKAVGGRIGYSLATGIVIALVLFLGLTALLLAVIPLVAILPILLFIGLVIGAQAFHASPKKHAPAVVLAIIPNIAAWGQTQVDGSLAAAGTSAAALGFDKLMGTGVVYHGMELVGGGAILAGLVLGAVAAFIIERQFRWAAGYAFIGAVLSFFGFIHGLQLEWAASPLIALGYALLGAICLIVSMREESAEAAPGWAESAED